MLKLIEKYPIPAIISLSLIAFLPHLDVMALTIMEARNFIVAREMVVDGNWILTTMNGIPRYEKPPLPTWLSAISGFLLGINNLFALRLPAILMVIFSGVFIYKLSLKFKFSNERSLINTFIFLTSFYIYGITIEAPWDIYTHGFTIAAIYYWIHFLENEDKNWKSILLTGMFLGFSFLSKGPIGLYTMFIPFTLAYVIVFQKFSDVLKNWKKLGVSSVLFLIIGGSWFLTVELADASHLNEITQHETQNWDSYNVRPFYYYWNFFIQSGIWIIIAFIGLLYPYLKNKVDSIKKYQFFLLWILFTFILLSIVPEKKSRYLVPILFPLAINSGFYLEYLIKNFRNIKRWEQFLIQFNFYLFGIIAIFSPFITFFYFKETILKQYLNFSFFSFFAILIGILMIISIKRQKVKMAFYYKVSFMAVIFLFALPFVKLLNESRELENIRNLNTLNSELHIKPYYFKEIAPELIWYYNGKIPPIQLNKDTNIPFGLLVNVGNIEESKKTYIDFNMKLIHQYNQNYFKNSRPRLIYNYYLISSKIKK